MEREKEIGINNYDRAVAAVSGALIGAGVISKQESLIAAGLTFGTIGAGAAKVRILIDKFEMQEKDES